MQAKLDHVVLWVADPFRSLEYAADDVVSSQLRTLLGGVGGTRSGPEGPSTTNPYEMGEFPVSGLSAANYGARLASWYGAGYSGALGSHYDEATPAQMDAVKAFVDLHACGKKY